MEIQHLIFCITAVLWAVVFLLLLILRRPRAAVVFLLRLALGWCAVWMVNYLGENVGIHIGQNPVNTGTVGILGLPGVGLLFMLRRLFIL